MKKRNKIEKEFKVEDSTHVKVAACSAPPNSNIPTARGMQYGTHHDSPRVKSAPIKIGMDRVKIFAQ